MFSSHIIPNQHQLLQVCLQLGVQLYQTSAPRQLNMGFRGQVFRVIFRCINQGTLHGVLQWRLRQEMLPHFQFPQCIGKDTMGIQVDCHLICSHLLFFSPHQDCWFPRISNIQDLILLCHLGCKSCRNSNPH